MKGFRYRLTAGISAAAIACSVLCAMPSAAADAAFTIEGEKMDGATLWTDIYQTEIPDFSGEGFAYLTNDTLSFEFEAPADGMYSIVVHGAQILSEEIGRAHV